MLYSMRWSHTYLFHILLQIGTLDSTTASTTITPRFLQSAVYDSSNNRAVYIGGTTGSSNVSSDVYVLDLSTKFNRTSPAFTSLPSLSTAVSDAAAVIDDTGKLIVLGGLQSTCSSSLITQSYAENATTWTKVSSTGAVPAPRQGARAGLLNGKIMYFGGMSLGVCSSSQYYFNTLYSVNPDTFNWTLTSSSSPPVAEAGMSLSPSGSGEFLLVGGEAVASGSTASWVGMTQFAQYSANTSSWSYLSAANSAKSITSRTGHSAVSNGSHTHVFGGAVGSTVSTPVLFAMAEQGASLNITSGNLPTNSAAAPSSSLYGHSAILTKNGIMVLSFGLVGSGNSSTFNTEVYLYDTWTNEWLDTYDPAANVHGSAGGKASLSVGSIVAIVLIPLLIITTGLIILLSIRKKRQNRRNRQKAFPVNRLGTFTPDEHEHDFDEKPFSDTANKDRGVHLPPWAAMHACQARSNFGHVSQPIVTDTPDPVAEMPDRRIKDYDIQDVQFAYPPSPRNMTFTAPRLQLRVVNPDAGSNRNSFDIVRAVPELIETSRSGLTTTVPLTITNEDDLELLRTKLSNSPMIGDIDDQLAGLGLVIREDTVHIPTTGEVHRVRTISRRKSQKMSNTRVKTVQAQDCGTPPRLSIVSDLSSSLDLDSVLAIGQSLYPPEPCEYRATSPEVSSYSPYLDSPRHSRIGTPTMSRQKSFADRTSASSSPIQAPSPTRRRLSGFSSTSRTGLLDPWPALNFKAG